MAERPNDLFLPGEGHARDAAETRWAMAGSVPALRQMADPEVADKAAKADRRRLPRGLRALASPASAMPGPG